MSSVSLINSASGRFWKMFWLWPLLAVFLAFRNFRAPVSKNIIWAFVIFYGFTFAIGTENSGSDIVRYVAEMRSLYGVDLSVPEAFEYYRSTEEVDVLKTLIEIVVSRFTESSSVLIAVYAFIFGYFFSRNMWFVLERLDGRLRLSSVLLLICFFLVVPIWNINGFRFWTATHIFFFGLWRFFIGNKKNGLVFCLASVLVHFSFLVPSVVIVAYIVLGERVNLYFVLFCVSILFSEIDVEVVRSLGERFVPDAFLDRSSAYIRESSVERFRAREGSASVWYAVWHGKALFWSTMLFLVVVYVKRRRFFFQNAILERLFAFTLLIFAVSNFLNSLPSGGRFLKLATMCALAVVVLIVQNNSQDSLLRRCVFWCSPALLLFVIVAFRIGLYSLSVTALVGNPLFALFISEHVSVNDLIK